MVEGFNGGRNVAQLTSGNMYFRESVAMPKGLFF